MMVEKWRWRIRWAGRMVNGKMLLTWDEVSREHPEAVKIPGTMTLVDVPQTQEERDAAYEFNRRPPHNFRPE